MVFCAGECRHIDNTTEGNFGTKMKKKMNGTNFFSYYKVKNFKNVKQYIPISCCKIYKEFILDVD